jgi:transcriptional regulator with XRE-family HTH domain
MDRLSLLRKYQDRNFDGSPLPEIRTNRDYAAILGVHESQLSRYYSGEQPVSMKALQGLATAFPPSRPEVMDALVGTAETPALAKAGAS